MSDMKELIIYQKHYDLMVYSFPIIGRFPKDQRFVLGQQIENQMLEIGKMIVHANKLKQKRGKLYDIDIELEKLRFLIRIAKDLKFLSISKYGHHCERLDEIGRLLGGWLKTTQGHG
jgi:four helix bundle protein